MTYLSEDPTYLAEGCLLLAGVVLGRAQRHAARQIPDSSRHSFVGLALMVVAIEWFWVTDNERIEQVVYDLRRAVLNSDVEGVLSHMAPNVQYLQGDTALSEDATRALIRTNLSHIHFDFVRISDLQTSAGQQSRRGKAEFRVFTRGRSVDSAGMMDAARSSQLGRWVFRRRSRASGR